jgi:predicted secreted acid phosphatase
VVFCNRVLIVNLDTKTIVDAVFSPNGEIINAEKFVPKEWHFVKLLNLQNIRARFQ